MSDYVIGLDYGSDSVRAVLVNVTSYNEVSSKTYYYPRWEKGLYCDPSINQFRQHPLDHVEGLEYTVKGIIEESGISGNRVKGICIDTTGSSPIALNSQGIPLAFEEVHKDNPNAMMILWKDHTAVMESDEINEFSRTWGGLDYTKYVGGVYSSEWFWAKILHIIRKDPTIKASAYTWMEHCDLMTYMLVGGDLDSFKRSRCAAGHKAMWHESWGGLPSEDFLNQLDPYLGTLRSRLYDKTYTSDEVAGYLSKEWAERLGLSTNCVVTVGTFDAHAGAVGAKIHQGALVRVMGTSTCDIMIEDKSVLNERTVKGICGQVNGSVVPGMVGLEAGQSAFGDVLAWFKEVLSWPLEKLVLNSEILSDSQKEALRKQIDDSFLRELSKEAEALDLSDSVPIALDWINGRRTPDANQNLKAAIKDLSLGTTAAHIFKALVQSICFGARMIVDRFRDEGVVIDKIVGIGGVARKSDFIMQTLADTLNMPILVASSDETPALGAAIYAAVAAGLFSNVIEASEKLGSDYEREYRPVRDARLLMDQYYEEYKKLASFIEEQTKN